MSERSCEQNFIICNDTRRDIHRCLYTYMSSWKDCKYTSWQDYPHICTCMCAHTLIYHDKITFRNLSNPFKELSSAYTIRCYSLHKQSTGLRLSPLWSWTVSILVPFSFFDYLSCFCNLLLWKWLRCQNILPYDLMGEKKVLGIKHWKRFRGKLKMYLNLALKNQNTFWCLTVLWYSNQFSCLDKDCSSERAMDPICNCLL